MRKYFSIILTFICLCFCTACGSNTANSNPKTDHSDVKDEGPVFLYLDSYPDSMHMSITDTYSVTIHYRRNETYSEPTTAKLVISSSEAEITNGETIIDNFESDFYSDANNTSTSFLITADVLKENSGEIKFEIQVLDKDQSVKSFSNKHIYFAKTENSIYLSSTSLEDVEKLAGISQSEPLWKDENYMSQTDTNNSERE